MKTGVVIIVLLIESSIFNFGFSQLAKAKVCFFQCPESQVMKVGPGNTVFMDKTFMCGLHNKKYSIQEIEPGDHTFGVRHVGKEWDTKDDNKLITIHIEAGKSYYIELMLIPHFFATSDLFCQEVPESTFRKVTKKYKQNVDCK